MNELHPSIAKLKENYPNSLLEVATFRGEITVRIPKQDLYEICRFLHSNPELQYHMLTDLCGVDLFPNIPRFEVVYLLYSFKLNHRLRLKVNVREGESVPSVESIWKAANWLEREVYDLFGITFENHPDLRRILLWDGYEGHPLRKDFPVEGPDFDKPYIPEV
ncbi:MAG: NADH-quinone oxidoreductase subunit C [Thermodesulfobacteriota bacterium]